jgi:hypothetical protein
MTYIVNQQKPLLMMGQFDNLLWENDMAHNYTCGLSMSDHTPTIIFLKVKPFTHEK